MPGKTFRWNAKDYSKNATAQLEWANELINLLQLKGGESVLDIGCGNGKITSMIAKIVSEGNVIGIDSSEEMIKLARENYSYPGFPNISFEVIDARKIPYKNSFDVIFSNAALHWVKEHEDVMKGISSSLKAQGRIILQMGGKGNAADILDCFKELMNESEWSNYFSDFNFNYSFLDTKDYELLLLKHGLIAKQIELIPKDMKQKGNDGLAGWIRTTWLPYLERIPEELKEKFISNIVERYIEKYPIDQDGIIHVKMVRLQVSAFKG